jgi:HEAT repeat protein
MRLLAVCLLLVPLAPRDLDVGVPPGTGLDWNREFRKPVPTGGRGGVPVPSTDEKPTPAGSTVAEERQSKDNLDFVVANLYDYFRVTTVDIMTHCSVSLPKSTGKVSQDDVATGGGFVMAWNYPPEMPVELVWMAAMACIREQVHPEVISWPESAAYCLELGEPSLYGAKAAAEGKIARYVTKLLKPLPPAAPQVPKAKDPKSAMLLRLAAVELSGGFPNALDPTFARRTLAIGNDSYGAVLECTKNPHPFLARNATSVLAHFGRDEVNGELIKLWKDSDDIIVRTRALLGLARRGEKSIVPDLVKQAQNGKDEPMQALAIYCLGLIGDPAGAKAVADLANAGGIKDTDLLWSAVPALGRMRGGKDVLIELEKQLRAKIGINDAIKIQGDQNTPTAEERGARLKVLRHLSVIALAMCGEKRFRDEVSQRVDKSGHDAFHRAGHYLLCEALAIMEDEKSLKKLIEANAGEDIIRLEALRALARCKKADGKYLAARAADETAPASVRSMALQLLGDVDPAIAKETCAKIVADYASKTGDLDANKAFVVAVAAQVGGRVKAHDVKDLVKAVDRAFNAKGFSRREGNNDPDITKAKVSLYPALLEALVIELGRTGSPDALALLKLILERSRAPQGRAEAALALGNIPGQEADEALVGALDDKDGWVRWCAYKALAKRSNEDHLCDWIFGDGEHRRKCVDAYKAWVKK